MSWKVILVQNFFVVVMPDDFKGTYFGKIELEIIYRPENNNIIFRKIAFFAYREYAKQRKKH